MPRIQTTDNNGTSNGYLVPVWSMRDRPEFQPDQVYVTVVAPHSVKGPHLHMKRRGMFCCIRGNVRIVVQNNQFGSYVVNYTGERSGSPLVHVPAGYATAIYNDGDDEAFVLNMPSPAWDPNDQDEWPVENWGYTA